MKWLRQTIDLHRAAYVAAGLMAFLATLGILGQINTARADGPSKPGKIAAVEQPSRTSWTGVYVTGFGAYTTGQVSFPGSPVGLAATGPSAGVAAGFTVQTGQLVFGAEIAHAWMFGDLKDIGIEREIEYTGRVGVLFGSNALVYGHGSFAQVQTAIGDIEGWKFGPGVEVRIPAEGWSVDLRGGYAIYDIEAMAPGLDANALWLRAGLVKRFDMPAGWFGR